MKEKELYFNIPLIPQAANKEITTPTKTTISKLLEPDAEPNPAPIAPANAPT